MGLRIIKKKHHPVKPFAHADGVVSPAFESVTFLGVAYDGILGVSCE